jgi:hypothetical protein
MHSPMIWVPKGEPHVECYPLDTLGRIYDCFTWNTFLRLVNRTSQIPYITQGVSTNLR